MSYRYVEGDLFAQAVDAICHGVNTEGLMGAGIAARFAKEYPEMKKKYVALCDENKLALGQVWVWKTGKKTIYNLATQNKPGKNADIKAIEVSFNKMLNHAETANIKSIGVPKIGCGIGGLRWENVSLILEPLSSLTDIEIVFVDYVNAGCV